MRENLPRSGDATLGRRFSLLHAGSVTEHGHGPSVYIIETEMGILFDEKFDDAQGGPTIIFV